MEAEPLEELPCPNDWPTEVWEDGVVKPVAWETEPLDDERPEESDVMLILLVGDVVAGIAAGACKLAGDAPVSRNAFTRVGGIIKPGRS